MTRGTDRKARMHRAPAKKLKPAIVARDPGRIHPGLTLPVLACTGVVASMLSPSSAVAVSLGDLRVQSTLGQALRATVGLETAAGEYAGASCVSAIAPSDPDLRSVPAARVQLPESGNPGVHELVLTTSGALFEPMYALALQVRCPGTALVVRQYVLMLDLPVSAPAVVAATTPAMAAPVQSAAPPAAVASATPAPVHHASSSRLAASHEPISPGNRYRVRQGDTLSGIAARVADRGGARLRPFATQILAANPGAFVHGNPDLIKLGSEIVIPAGVADAAQDKAVAATTRQVAQPTATTVAVGPVAAPVAATPVTSVAPVTTEQSGQMPGPAAAKPVAAITPAVTPRVFADEPVRTVAAPPKVVAAEPAAPRKTATRGHPVLSALAGLFIGIVLSLALMRQRLTEGLARLLGRQSDTEDMGLPVTRPAAPTPSPRPVTPKRLRAAEGTMVVEESRLEPEDKTDELLAVAPAPAMPPPEPSIAITMREEALSPTATMAGMPPGDLGALFDDPAITAELPDTATIHARTTESSSSLDLDLTGALDMTTASTHVEDIGWVGDASDASDASELTQTNRAMAMPPPAGLDPVNMDLNALAQVDNSDARLSDTLREALALLEKDYEDEFSASQALNIKDLQVPSVDTTDNDATIARTGTNHGRK